MSIAEPDDFGKINHALDTLQGNKEQFFVRLYLQYVGAGQWKDNDIEKYINSPRKINLVLQYQSQIYNLNDWIETIKLVLDKYAKHLEAIQITEEPNLYHVPVIDGCMPHVREALVNGAIEAKKYIVSKNLNVKVGFNAVPNFNPTGDFWEAIYNLGGEKFVESLDFVGLDFFPDVFRPVAADGQPGDLVSSVVYILDKFCNIDLQKANIPFSVPIVIAENGWPTARSRSYERQSQVLETIIRTVFDNRSNFNITQYQLFCLRDSDSGVEDIFYQFGILKDDYSPKPAFLSIAIS